MKSRHVVIVVLGLLLVGLPGFLIVNGQLRTGRRQRAEQQAITGVVEAMRQADAQLKVVLQGTVNGSESDTNIAREQYAQRLSQVNVSGCPADWQAAYAAYVTAAVSEPDSPVVRAASQNLTAISMRYNITLPLK